MSVLHYKEIMIVERYYRIDKSKSKVLKKLCVHYDEYVDVNIDKQGRYYFMKVSDFSIINEPNDAYRIRKDVFDSWIKNELYCKHVPFLLKDMLEKILLL